MTFVQHGFLIDNVYLYACYHPSKFVGLVAKQPVCASLFFDENVYHLGLNAKHFFFQAKTFIRNIKTGKHNNNQIKLHPTVLNLSLKDQSHLVIIRSLDRLGSSEGRIEQAF